MNTLGIGIAGNLPVFGKTFLVQTPAPDTDSKTDITVPFVPNRVTSWWSSIEDLQWPQKKIVDKIRSRAEAFAEAEIDTAINFGFHVRFDFADYLGQLHGYYANVCEELHKQGIKFMDHYSCNHVERPRGEEEFRRLHRNQRHHVLLFHDPVAAEHAQYEGHYFRDICQVNLLDGSRGYARQYQFEAFCHNNPGFLDMHRKYLMRLMKDVPFDGLQVDDMCDYAGLIVCGCQHCRDRFRAEYGLELPPLDDNDFWGDTTNKSEFLWGNYENPDFRNWLNMRADSIADHLKMVKDVIGNKPLMTCCSSSGPISLNAVNLNLERMSPMLDFFMLENCGININSVNWLKMDAEALHQKDIADKKGNAPAMALSYTIFEKGGYLGWCLSRFWGVANWSSTLNQRLEEDPADMMEIEDIVKPYNNWETKNSPLYYREGKDLVEVRVVNSRYCKENGWRGEDGEEQWDKSAAWSAMLVRANVGYRFVRCEELSDAEALCSEDTPLVLDSVACVSDIQFFSIRKYLSRGGTAWLAMPFGTHNEKGFKRPVPLSEALIKSKYKHLVIISTATASNALEQLIQKGKFHPVLKQLSGDERWSARIRFYADRPVIHLLSNGLIAVPHPSIKDMTGIPILQDIETSIEDTNLTYRINSKKIPLTPMSVMSPELGIKKRDVTIRDIKSGLSEISVNLEGVKVYAVVQCNTGNIII
jgi:hypothetical protein